MYALVYLWRVAVNIFYIFIVIYVFSKLYTRDERLYVSILGLLYVSIRSIGFGTALGIIPALVAIGRQVDRIREHVDTTYTILPSEEERLEKLLSRNGYRTAIEALGLMVISGICLLELFNALNTYDF